MRGSALQSDAGCGKNTKRKNSPGSILNVEKLPGQFLGITLI